MERMFELKREHSKIQKEEMNNIETEIEKTKEQFQIDIEYNDG